jgi:hypothetical protein
MIVTSFRTEKIHYRNIEELNRKLAKLEAKQIIRIESCLPEETNTNVYCVELFLEYYYGGTAF